MRAWRKPAGRSYRSVLLSEETVGSTHLTHGVRVTSALKSERCLPGRPDQRRYSQSPLIRHPADTKKEPIQEMVLRLLPAPGLPGKDAADALGLGVCHAHASKSFAAIENAMLRERGVKGQHKGGRVR